MHTAHGSLPWSHCEIQENRTSLGKVSRNKVARFWILSKLPPPPAPIWTTWKTFLNAKNGDGTFKMTHYPKFQKKYWHFGGNRLLLLIKNVQMKRWHKIWAGPSPPLIWTKSKRRATFVKLSWNLPLCVILKLESQSCFGLCFYTKH